MELKKRGPKGDEVEKLASKPEMDNILGMVAAEIFRCWNDCGPNRQIGFGVVGCIPREAVFGWCRDEKRDDEATRTYWRVIQRLDADRMDREDSKRRLKK